MLPTNELGGIFCLFPNLSIFGLSNQINMRKFFLLVFIILAELVAAKAQPGFTDISSQAARRLSILQKSIEPLYRKPSKEELKLIDQIEA